LPLKYKKIVDIVNHISFSVKCSNSLFKCKYFNWLQ